MRAKNPLKWTPMMMADGLFNFFSLDDGHENILTDSAAKRRIGRRWNRNIEKEDTMDDAIRQALEQDRTIDITTIGRKTGQRRRIEIWFHNLDGEFYITGLPRPCNWYANFLAHPEFTFHLKQTTQADLPARATPVLEPEARREVLSRIQKKLGRTGDDLEARVAGSPLVRVELRADL